MLSLLVPAGSGWWTDAQHRMHRRLTVRNVRRLRSRIARNRCTVRPGLTHAWHSEPLANPLGETYDVTWCTKCDVIDGAS